MAEPQKPRQPVRRSRPRRPAVRNTGSAPRETHTARQPDPVCKVENPIIGITSGFLNIPAGEMHECDYFYMYEPYVNAIHKAGGVPIIIPVGLEGRYNNRVFDLLHGLLLTGGGDIDPNQYGDLMSVNLRKVSPRKDRTEIELFNLAFNKNIPILGICRGIQLINVALDGTLYQDIPSQIRMAMNHFPSFPPDESCHDVRLETDTKLYKALGDDKIWVNSRHHQAIKLHGKGLIVNARASDGVIEGVEHPNKKWVVGVQWHPEMMYLNDKYQVKLFKAFIDACKE